MKGEDWHKGKLSVVFGKTLQCTVPLRHYIRCAGGTAGCRTAAMKLLTHNLLACHIKGHQAHQDETLKIEATKVRHFLSYRRPSQL